MDNWTLVRFENAPIEIIDGDRGVNYPKQSDFLVNGHCLFLNARNVTNQGFNFSNCSFINEEKDKKLRKGKLTRQDIILTTRGTVGNVAFYDDSISFQHIRINSGMVIFRSDTSVLLPRFLYFFLRSQLFLEQMKALSTGSAQPQLPIKDIKRVKIPLPPLPEQRAIADVLGALDDKIELNRRMNETLEGLARALFKSWFVDFDPVRRNAERRMKTAQPDPRHPEDALFPAAFEGEIPQGWRVGQVKDICAKIENGGTPKRDKPEYWEPGTIPWLTSGEVRQSIVVEAENKISELGFQNSSAKLWQSGTTVVALYGATAGEVCLLANEMCSNQACCGLTPTKNTEYFLYLSLSSAVKSLALQARGSAQQNLSQQLVAEFPINIPDEKILEQFHILVNPLFTKWIANLQQSRTLAALRDALLPRLMSGEIRVKAE